jgi:SAM-dependent methyltransferase
MSNTVTYDPVLGTVAPTLGWVPAPRYLLRRALVLRRISQLAPCDTLEIGCGAGALLHELSARGFRCTALESSKEARNLATELAQAGNKSIEIVAEPGTDWARKFSLLMAFEVLEHIEQDFEAISAWREWLVPGGKLLLSVPAHMAKWNPSDVWAGHFRRYERADLQKLLERAGFRVERIDCYGFPLANFVEKIRARVYSKEVNSETDSTSEGKQKNSDRSGIDRRHELKWFSLYGSVLGKLALQSAELAQRAFFSTELGNGYLVLAEKR